MINVYASKIPMQWVSTKTGDKIKFLEFTNAKKPGAPITYGLRQVRPEGFELSKKFDEAMIKAIKAKGGIKTNMIVVKGVDTKFTGGKQWMVLNDGCEIFVIDAVTKKLILKQVVNGQDTPVAKDVTEIIRQEIRSVLKESQNSDSLKSILKIAKIGKFFGIFNENFFKEIQEAVTKKVQTSLDAYKAKIPSDKMEDYNSLVKDLLLPLKNAKTFEEFILVANNISKYSNKIKIDESIDLKSTIATLEKDLKAIVKDVKGLWNKTKENRIFLSIVTILARILLMTFFGVIHELLRLNQGASW
jgi:hypothetical protein